MDAFIQHPLIHSLLSKLRDNFGEKGRVELRADIPTANLRLIPENICIGFRRMGWTATHETNGPTVTFRFSQPPDGALPCSPKHTAAATQLLARIHRFLETRAPGLNHSYPLNGAVPYRVADLAAKVLRNSGTEATLIGDASGRLSELLLTLPSDPSRAQEHKLTE